MNILPAEWHTQDCVQLTWPHKETDWLAVYDQAIICFRHIAKEISKRQKLLIACKDAQAVLLDLIDMDMENIQIIETDNDDTWARDHGGITIYEDNQPIVCDFRFNGWGHKFSAEKDNAITASLFYQSVFSCKRLPFDHFVLEGGSIESDGCGTVLTTEGCLLTTTRNPTMDKSAVELLLKQTFGLNTVLWLKHGYLAGDDTDGHIDTLARFVSPTHIVYVQCDSKDDEHYEALQLMEKELQAFTQSDGKPYQLTALPMVSPMYYEGERLPATYVNFLIMNTAVLVPIYGQATDEAALRVFAMVFPNYEIVPIDCSVLVIQHGSLHCLTMQFPQGVL